MNPRQKQTPSSRRPQTQEPPHGKIIGYYAIVYDRHIRREIIVPVSRLEIMKGTIRLP
jgi:hypothetical protein